MSRTLFEADQPAETPGDRRLRVALVLANGSFLRYYEGMVRELVRNSHDVDVIVGGMTGPRDGDASTQPDDIRSLIQPMIQPRNRGWSWLLWPARETMGYGVYFRSGHPSRDRAVRWRFRLPPRLRAVLSAPLIGRVATSRPAQTLLRQMQAAVPVDSAIRQWLQTRKPQVVIASPCIFHFPLEVEYLRAAKSLGIPTVAIVASWDNLTTKGTFAFLPDATFVWNTSLRREAVSIHDIPAETVVVTGAPPFDFCFESKPRDRENFCRVAGIDPDRPYVVYACSSGSIAGDEVSFVEEFAAGVRGSADGREVQILVRPHPRNADIWARRGDGLLRVWPPAGSWPDSTEARQDFFDTIYHSSAVVGINTSAFLDAACIDRPCITILSERYHATQTGIGHFQHLLGAGFVEVAAGSTEAGHLVRTVLRGEDPRATQRREFVRSFIRPRGPGRAASAVAAAAVEAMARGTSPRQIETDLERLSA